MKKKISRFFYLVAFLAVGALFAIAQISFAQDSFQNNLLKMEVAPTSSGGIKMTFYTNKPYVESVVVNKKSDFEYVILMPETSNSMTASPVLNSVAQSVKGLSVKTQQYDGQTKGYTKIMVRTTKPIEITSQVKTITKESQLAQQDYDELLAQVKKKETVVLRQKRVEKSVEPAIKKQTPPVFNHTEVLKRVKIASMPIEKPVIKSSVKPVNKVLTPTKNVLQAVKPEVKKAPEVAASSTVQEQLPVGAQKQNVLQEAPKQAQPEPVVPIVATQETQPPLVTLNPPKEKKLNKYIGMIKNNVVMILGFVFALFLILLLGARRMVKNVHKQKEIFTSHLQEKPPISTDYSEKIKEDMSWREKFQTYVETSQEADSIQNVSEEEPSEENPHLDDLFKSESSVNENELTDEQYYQEDYYDEAEDEDQSDEISEETEFEQEDDEIISPLDGFGETEYDDSEDVSLDDLLDDEEDFISEEEFEEEQEEQEEQDNLVKSEFVIDDEKGFYLVDFEDTSALVGHIDDEIFVLKRFESKIEDKLQARLSETRGNISSYMARVGNFKGLVEVTPEKMNLLIEL